MARPEKSFLRAAIKPPLTRPAVWLLRMPESTFPRTITRFTRTEFRSNAETGDCEDRREASDEKITLYCGSCIALRHRIGARGRLDHRWRRHAAERLAKRRTHSYSRKREKPKNSVESADRKRAQGVARADACSNRG